MNPNSMLCANRQTALAREVQWCRYSAGDCAEFGVASGGSAIIIREAAPLKTLHLFDSFEGLPKAVEHDRQDIPLGACKATVVDMWETLGRWGEFNTVLHRGLFEATVPRFIAPLAFAHIDCDLYEGTHLCLTKAMKLMTTRGSIVVDDYHPDFLGVMKAVDELSLGWKRFIVKGTPHDSIILCR